MLWAAMFRSATCGLWIALPEIQATNLQMHQTSEMRKVRRNSRMKNGGRF
jgi:hypothetical protein